MDKRAYNLTNEPTKSYSSSISNDKSGNLEALAITMDTLLRKATTNTMIDQSGAIVADFTNYDQIIINAIGSITVTITGVSDGDGKSKLVINRTDPNTQTVAFSGIAGTIDGPIKGISTLYYNVFAANSIILLKQANRQFGGSFSGITSVDLTSISIVRATYQLNDNICNFSIKITGNTVGIIDKIRISISDFNVNNKYTDESINAYVLDTDLNLAKSKSAIIEDTTSIIIDTENIGNNQPLEISLNGTFEID